MLTEKLFYQDAYLKEFTARIREAVQLKDGSWGIILDRTAFYPEGGGQPGDTGYLNDLEVIDTRDYQGEVLHITRQKPTLEVTVDGRINWQRRFDHMQQHSGEHLLTGAFRAVLGANNVGFHLGQLSSTIDLDIERLSEEEAIKAENLANEMVLANIPISTVFTDRAGALQYNLRKQPEKEFSQVRLVLMKDFDNCPCGGTHVVSSGQVGLIKIRFWEKKKGVRVDFVCGNRALQDYQEKNRQVHEISTKLCVPCHEILDAFDRQQERLSQLKKESALAKKQYIDLLAEKVFDSAEKVNGIMIISHLMEEAEREELELLAKNLTNRPENETFVILLAAISARKDKVFLQLAVSPATDLKMAVFTCFNLHISHLK